MFHLDRARRHKGEDSGAPRKKRLFALLFAALITVSSIASVPMLTTMNVSAVTTAASRPNDFSWQAKSFLYYRAIAHCMAYSSLSMATNSSVIDASDAAAGKWFTGGGPTSGQITPTAPAIGVFMRDATSGDALDVGTDGKVNCNNESLVKSALSTWGLNAIDTLCESGFRRENLGASQTVATCKEGTGNFVRRDGGMANNRDKFTAYIRNAIYGGSEPNLTDPQWYIYYRHSLSQSCIAGLDSKAPSATPQNSDNPYGYNGVKWVDISATSVADAVKTGSYVGTWQTSTNVGLRVGAGSGFNNFERSCAETVTLMNNYANAYAQWAITNKEAAEGVEGTIDEGSNTGANGESPTSCVVEGTGWIVCSIAKTLAQMIDGIYSLLVQFLMVQPLNIDTTSNDNFVYRVWSIMQGIANVLFVIAFLIIIFSQLTSVGISNYGVKKLLPRLIVSAILVNTSFWISAVLVDISNIAGSAIYNAITEITDNLGGINPQTNVWETAVVFLMAGTGIVLSGGAIIAAGTLGASASAALWSILPAILAAILAIIVAFAVLAARQALIVILIILSPLAFVAYLLPNTESLFKLWKNSLQTMLIFYPIFALIFAGSQLAAFIIISSIPPNSAFSMPMTILGLFTMVAPLIITPMLIKFSGGIIGQLAGRINNSNKGLIDRAKKTASNKRQIALGETLGSERKTRNPFTRMMRGGYRRIQNGGRLDADRQKAIEAQNQAVYDESKAKPRSNGEASLAQQAYNKTTNAQTRSKKAENDARASYLKSDGVVELEGELHASKVTVDAIQMGTDKNVLKRAQSDSRVQDMLAAEKLAKTEKSAIEARQDVNVAKTLENDSLYKQSTFRETAAKAELENIQGKEKAAHRELISEATAISASNPLATEIAAARAVEQQSNLTRERMASVEGVLQQEYAQAMTDETVMTDAAGNKLLNRDGSELTVGTVLAQQAGGIDTKRGPSRAVARATQVVEEARRKAVSAEFDQLKLKGSKAEELVKHIAAGTNSSGQAANQDELEAMIQYVGKVGTTENVIAMTDAMAGSNYVTADGAAPADVLKRNRQLQQTFGEAASASGAMSISGGSYGKLATGEQLTGGYDSEMIGTIGKAKFKGESFAKMDIDEMLHMERVVETPNFDAELVAASTEYEVDNNGNKVLDAAGAPIVKKQGDAVKAKVALHDAIQRRLTDPILSAGLSERDKTVYQNIQSKLNLGNEDFTKYRPNSTPSAPGSGSGPGGIVMPDDPGGQNPRFVIPHDDDKK